MESLSSALLRTKHSINLQLSTRSVLCPSQSPRMTERLKPSTQSPSPQQHQVENRKELVPSLLVTQADEPRVGTPVSLLKAFWGYSVQMLERSSGEKGPPAL